jgi:hypothetical protein
MAACMCSCLGPKDHQNRPAQTISWYRAVLGVCYVGRRGAVRCLDCIMRPSGAHSRRTRCSLGSTRARASRRNAFGGSETARNGSETHGKRLYSPLTPVTDVGQPLIPWGGVRGGLRWPSVVVSEQASERARRALFFIFLFRAPISVHTKTSVFFYVQRYLVPDIPFHR